MIAAGDWALGVCLSLMVISSVYPDEWVIIGFNRLKSRCGSCKMLHFLLFWGNWLADIEANRYKSE